jgi:hypothetical protein
MNLATLSLEPRSIRLVNDQELHLHRGDEVRQRSEHTPPIHHHQLLLHHQGELRGNYAHRRQAKTTFFQGIRIRIHVFLGHPDPLVRGMDPDPVRDPDPSIIKQI